MGRVHENLPNEKFTSPAQGLVRASVCSKSGLLPIPGVCDGNISTEYFAEGTVPTERCTIHYEGAICNYDQMPATPECPFPVPGTATLPLIEDESLLAGSTMVVKNPDGTQTPQTPNTTTHCMHDAAFFANPDYEAILAGQQAEIDQRNAAMAPPPEEGGQEEGSE